jgi:hypothetical protein
MKNQWLGEALNQFLGSKDFEPPQFLIIVPVCPLHNREGTAIQPDSSFDVVVFMS